MAYTIDYFEVEDGWYWALYKDGERINGGIRDTQLLASYEADHRMRYDQSLQWAIEKGYKRAT